MSLSSQGPSGRPRPLRINTAHATGDRVQARLSAESPSITPTVLVSTPHHVGTLTPTSPSLVKTSPKPVNRARNESRKLLAHVLAQLQNRPRPPPVYGSYLRMGSAMGPSNMGVLLETVKGVVKLKQGKRESEVQSPTDDGSDDEDYGFSPETTFDLIVQLKDLLVISKAQGWQIFDDGGDPEERNGAKRSTLRSRRSRTLGSETRSGSPSPIRRNLVDAPELLSICISVIESIILEDCRHKITRPRPSRPPNALQSLTLDVVHFLLHQHRNDPKIVANLGSALIPAFSTFGPEMHPRLLSFFERSVIREILSQLREVQDPTGSELVEVGQQINPSVSTIVSIYVDEVQDSVQSIKHSAIYSPLDLHKFKSTNAPHQAMAIYQLSSLIPPLVGIILDYVDILGHSSNYSETRHYAQRLLDLIIKTKSDVYLDLLQVVAHHTPKARYVALCLMTRYWPEVLGHVLHSKPFPISSPTRVQQNHLHQFVPWKVARKSTLPGIGMLRRFDCRSCSKSITGFCLLCPWCMCTVHFDCYDYPEGNEMIQYTMVSDSSMKRVAMYRYSPLPFTGSRIPITATSHKFEPINLFTLCLCFVCRTPLWGLIEQGLHCGSCSQFVHRHCLEGRSQKITQCDPNQTNSDHMNIDWAQLRASCIDYYGDILALTAGEPATRGYEELSILQSMLWMQLQLITNGVALGSVIVMQRGQSAAHGKGHQIDEFELHSVMATCTSLLSSRPISPSTEELLRENSISREDHCLFYDWSNLAFITSLIKAPHSVPRRRLNASTDLLNVAPPELHEAIPDTIEHPYDTVPLSHLHDALHQELNVTCQTSRRLLLAHLHHLGMFVMGSEESLSGKDDHRCSFVLPFLLDISTDVETLVTAVESSLMDLDLTVNEVGFLLLSRQLWPDGLASEYALRRLSRVLISWILAEDEHLATILQGYIAKHKPLPGLRSPTAATAWPTAQNARSAPTISVNNGGEYLSARRVLLARYVVPWLIALHDQDTHTYTIILHDICFEYAQNELSGRDHLGISSSEDRKKYNLDLCESALRAMAKLSHSSVTFTVFDDLFIQWLDFVSRSGLIGEAVTSLSRLFSKDGETYQRSASLYDAAGIPTDNVTHPVVDPWRTINNFSMQSKDSLSRSLQWLCIFAASGVEISDANLLRYPNLMTRYESPLSDAGTLVKAALASIWLRSIGRQGLQRLFGLLHAQYTPEVLESLTKGVEAELSLLFVRQSLCACLLLYSCERTKLSEFSFIQEDEIAKLPSRRKLQTRATTAADPLLLDSHILAALQDYMALHVNDLSCLIVKFLHSFTESPLLEPHEVDNFILKNGTFLSSCAWEVYEIQRHDIASIRTSFFLRVLVVDPQPFQNLLDTYFRSTEEWERRLTAVTRLFRIVLDVTSPAFTVEDRQWRSSVVDVFYHFFASLWLDDTEEIRLATRTFASSLLPAHFDAITLCWNEVLSKAPVEDRVKLVSFLIQLHPHFPSWQVLSWGVILETLRIDEVERGTRYDPTLSPSTQSALESTEIYMHDTETIALHVSIMALSLQLIADGIPIDYPTLLSLKSHLMRLFGIGDMHPNYSFYMPLREIETVPQITNPCLDILRHVLDSTHAIEVPSFFTGNQDGKNNKLLIGSPFLDILFAIMPIIRETFNLPVLTTKNILEALYIAVHKYDFESPPLKPLQPYLKRAVAHALFLMTQDVSYEARQVALSASQAFIRRWNSIMGSVVYVSLESSAKLIISQGHHSQDILMSQAKKFMETTLETYSNHGLFLNLLKRPLEKDFFLILKQIVADSNVKTSSGEPLKEALLRDTISRIAESDLNSFHTVLTNLQSFIEVVYHQGYGGDLMSFCGLHLTHIARRTPEYAVDAFDPTPLLRIPAILIQHNKLNSRDMLSSADTILRIILNRLNVPSQSIIKLLAVTTTLYRKTANDGSSPINPIAGLINEILMDGLRMKARVTPSTLRALIETITSDEIIHSVDIGSMLLLADHATHFLFLHAWQDLHSDDDFMASMAVARLILRGAKYEPNVIIKFANYTNEFTQRPARHPLAIRAWNLLLLAALQDHNHDWGSVLCSHLPLFSIVHHHVLRWYLQFDSIMPETVTTDINHAYISLKLWIMLTKNGDFHAALTIWGELWPPFENLANALDADKLAGSNIILGPLVSSSIADLFLFLASLHTPLVLQTSSHIALLNRLRTLGRPDGSSNKITRALRALADPPAEVAVDDLVNQVAKEIVAVEKVRMLEAKRDVNSRAN